MEDGGLVTPMVLTHPVHQAGRGISAQICGLDDVFPPDDFSYGSQTQCKVIYIFPEHKSVCETHTLGSQPN